MSNLADDERQALAAAILGRTNINALPKTERAVERIVAARLRVQAEQIATAIEDEACGCVPEGDGVTCDRTVIDAARIAREHAPKED